MTAISKPQIAAIHAAASSRGMEDAEYRSLLAARFGAKSCKELSRAQASELLRTLGLPLARRPRRRRRSRRPPLRGAIRMATPAQRELIAEMAAEIDWRESFETWLRDSQKLISIRTAAEAERVIEGLKAIKRRPKR